jgi:hypothetical protein
MRLSLPNSRPNNPNAKGTRWVLTINLGSDSPEHQDSFGDRIDAVRTMYDAGELVYAVGSYERGGNSNRLHIQAYLMFKKQVRWGYVVGRIQQAWAEVQYARDDEQARDYADDPGKEGYVSKAFEFGTFPSKGAGRRTDLDRVKHGIDEGTLKSWRDVNDVAPGVAARYPDWINNTIEERVRDEILEYRRGLPAPQEYVWQHYLKRIVTELEPDDRRIIFVVGKRGHEGKSHFLRTLSLSLGDGYQLVRPGKKSDMVEAVRSTCRVLAVDIARGQQDFVGHVYPFLEEIKDGEVFNPKYRSRMKPITPCHVVVMMNCDVDVGEPTQQQLRTHSQQTRVDEFRYTTMGIFPPSRAEPKGQPPLSHDRYLIWELSDSLMEPWSEDHPRWGTQCPPFRSFTASWDMVPYHPPLVADSGPAFNGDIAGDGPAMFLGPNANSQDTVLRGIQRYEFVPVVRLVRVCDEPSEERPADRWTSFDRDQMEFHDLTGDRFAGLSERAWYDALDIAHDWVVEDGIDHPPEGIYLTLAHMDDLPESVLYSELGNLWTSDTVLVQQVVVHRRYTVDAAAEHAAAA